MMQLQSIKKQIIFSSLLCFSVIAFPVASQAITVQEVPNPRQNHTWVTDKANILSDSTETQLNQMIAELEAKNGSEIAVVTVPNTKPSATPKAFATELFNYWEIVKKGKNNGVLLLISSGEGRVQIETGSGIQDILPDAKTVSIIQREITPKFKHQDFDGGTLAGTKALVNVLQTPIANVQSQNALPLAPIVPSQARTPSAIPAESPVVTNSGSTGESLRFFLIFFSAIGWVIWCRSSSANGSSSSSSSSSSDYSSSDYSSSDSGGSFGGGDSSGDGGGGDW
jgi:uncharacterized protein